MYSGFASYSASPGTRKRELGTRERPVLCFHNLEHNDHNGMALLIGNRCVCIV
jgi:hypothetical protein